MTQPLDDRSVDPTQRFGRPPAVPGPPPYPVPPGGYPYPILREHPQGNTVLVLGILGLFFTPLGFVAWYLGGKAEEEIETSGLVWSNASTVRVGKILGMVTGILTIVSVGLVITAVVLTMLGVFGVLSALG
jgi:hypothetical protein